jgi:hypothetical protein
MVKYSNQLFRKVSEIYKMRAKEVADVESAAQRALKAKYHSRLENNPNKYLSRDYSGINQSAQKILENQKRVIIDPSKNSQKLEQILGNRAVDGLYQNRRKYQPLSENYRGVENKLSLQMANPTPTSGHYHLIGRAGSRGNGISSVTPHSDRKDALLISKLKENHNNPTISNRGHYLPPRGLRKIGGGGVNSQRSQPIMSGLKNNLARRYVSNQHSIDNPNVGRGLPPTVGILNQRRVDLNSGRTKQRINSRQQYNAKPMSAKTPSWWG